MRQGEFDVHYAQHSGSRQHGDCSVSRQRARWIVAALMPLAILAIPYAPRAAAADSGDSGTQQSGTQDLQPPGTLAQLNDIIVTAQRKEERLQDVGISITALSADELQQMDITKPPTWYAPYQA